MEQKGHVALHVLVKFLFQHTRRLGGKAGIPDRDALNIILADITWADCTCDDHKSLKRKISRVFSELEKKKIE